MYKSLKNGWKEGKKEKERNKKTKKKERHEQAVHWKQIPMTNKLTCVTHLEKVPVKTMTKYHFCLPHCLVLKSLIILNVLNKVKKNGHSHPTVESVNW